MDELLQQIERLAAANQALTQRLDREHSMRLAAEERVALCDSQTSRSRAAEGNEIALREIAELVVAMHEQSMGPALPGSNAEIVSAVRALVDAAYAQEDRCDVCADDAGGHHVGGVPMCRDCAEDEPAPIEVCDECGAETDDEGCAINPSSAALASWERRAHEAEAALEALRADAERDRVASRAAHLIQWYGPNGEKRSASAVPMEDRAVASVCELLAAWGRLMDRNDARGAVAEARTAARTAALWDAHDAASDAIRLLARGTR